MPLGAPGDERFVLYWNRNEQVAVDSDSRVFGQAGTWISSPDGDGARLLSQQCFPVGWSSDGEWVYVWVFDDRYLARVSVVTGVMDSLGTLPDAPLTGIAASPAAKRLVYPVWVSTSDIWLLEHIPRP